MNLQPLELPVCPLRTSNKFCLDVKANFDNEFKCFFIRFDLKVRCQEIFDCIKQSFAAEGGVRKILAFAGGYQIFSKNRTLPNGRGMGGGDAKMFVKIPNVILERSLKGVDLIKVRWLRFFLKKGQLKKRFPKQATEA